MLFFEGNDASRPTGEGCDGALLSDDANEEKALRLHEAPVLSWPRAALCLAWCSAPISRFELGRSFLMEKSHQAVVGAGVPWLYIWVKTHLFSLCSHGSLFSAFGIDGHLCPSMGRRNNLSCVIVHRWIVVQNCLGMDHQISFVLSPA